ncbi:MAG: DUF167 domain-containing protein [Acidimicrobiales bacterium]|nr:DUF167 domain-containing protein [Acidimicrobiales bacterium]NNF08834.1 DUF167 domain-containing protein [Acidimicrobiia bacterium]
MADSLRFEVRVRPRARSTSVGGTWGPADALVVSVTDPAVDGRANRAVLKLLASALHVRPRQLSIASGAHHRSKVIELSDPPPGTRDRLEHLRVDPG